MISNEKAKTISLQIQRLIEENRPKESSEEEEEEGNKDEAFLSRLLAELETLRGEGKFKRQNEEEASAEAEEDRIISEPVGNDLEEEEKKKEKEEKEMILEELRKVKKQNVITHCLLSALIVVTLVWQLSEVSLILKVKDGLNNPFRSIGNMVKDIVIRKRPGNDRNDGEDNSSQMEAPPSIPPLKMPELPQMDFGLNGQNQ